MTDFLRCRAKIQSIAASVVDDCDVGLAETGGLIMISGPASSPSQDLGARWSKELKRIDIVARA